MDRSTIFMISGLKVEWVFIFFSQVVHNINTKIGISYFIAAGSYIERLETGFVILVYKNHRAPAGMGSRISRETGRYILWVLSC